MRTLLIIFCLSVLSGGVSNAADNSLILVVDLTATVGSPPEPNHLEVCPGIGWQRLWKGSYYSSLTLELCPFSESLSFALDFLAPLGSTVLVGPIVVISMPFSALTDVTGVSELPVYGGVEIGTCRQAWLCPSVIVGFGGDIRAAEGKVQGMLSILWTPSLMDW
jgi:hypothetical protein